MESGCKKNMDKQAFINRTAEYVRNVLEGEGSGHDWFHVQRVWKTAKYLGGQEKADLFVVELAALLHDIADWKLNDGDEKAGLKKVEDWLTQNELEKTVLEQVLFIVDNMSFSKELEGKRIDTIEGFVVQDADRLDALGAVGIARTFAYGGNHSRPLYDPAIKPKFFDDFEEYKKYKTTSLNHFYEKVLLIKDRLNTESAKELGEKRHQFVENYLEQFLAEWECEYAESETKMKKN